VVSLFALACGGCAEERKDRIDFGEVPAGWTRTAWRDGEAVSGEGALEVAVVGGRVVLACAAPGEGEVTIDGVVVPWSCEQGEAPADPLVEIGVAPVASNAESGLGDGTLAGDAAFVPVPASGDLLLLDTDGARVWRQGPFYRVGSWGLWTRDERTAGTDWVTPPACFGGGEYLHQDGRCTGEEREADGSVPEGWAYVHPGFADGAWTTGADVPEAGVVVLAKGGAVGVLDASLEVSLGDESAYSRFQLTRAVTGEAPGDADWAAHGEDAVAEERSTGDVFRASGLGTVTPDVRRTGETLGPASRCAPAPDRLWCVDDGGELWLVDGDVRREASVGSPARLAASEDDLWLWYDEGWLRRLGADGETETWARVPEADLLAADPLGLAWVIAGDAFTAIDGPDSLASAVVLPDRPVALTVDPVAHDAYVAYRAGSAGCDGALADGCAGGVHPALIHSFYARAGPEEAVSSGHPLNLMLAPLIETPTDDDVDLDWSEGTSDCAGTDAEIACCLLAEATDRVDANLSHLEGLGGAVVVGVNPTWLRQARICDDEAALSVLNDHAAGVTFSRLAHTDLAADGAVAWYLDRVGAAWTAPVDAADEYAALQAALADLFDYADLDRAELEIATTLTGGNAFDWPSMVGWETPGWVLPARNATAPPITLSYFAAAGALPRIGLDGYRKKELFPLEMSERAEVLRLGSGLTDWATAGDTDVLYLPGLTWALNTVGDVAASGAFRESAKFGIEVEEADWTAVRRYLRRILSSAGSSEVKSCYLHIYDISAPDGLMSDYTPDGADEAGLAAIEQELMAPGWARWSTPEQVAAEAGE
jgi:hypothetical protein